MSVTQSEIDSLIAAAEDLAPAGAGSAPQMGQRPTEPSSGSQAPATDRRDLPQEIQRILKMRVPVIVKLPARDMPTSEVIKLTGGSILEFEHPADAELELLVNNKTIGHGEAVKVGENFGLRITRIDSMRDTITALRPG